MIGKFSTNSNFQVFASNHILIANSVFSVITPLIGHGFSSTLGPPLTAEVKTEFLLSQSLINDLIPGPGVPGSWEVRPDLASLVPILAGVLVFLNGELTSLLGWAGGCNFDFSDI